MSARKKAEKRDRNEKREKERKRRFGVNAIISETDDGVDAETSLSFFLSLSLSLHFYLSSPPFFSRSLLVNKYILKMRVSSKELFSTLKSSIFITCSFNFAIDCVSAYLCKTRVGPSCARGCDQNVKEITPLFDLYRFCQVFRFCQGLSVIRNALNG